MTLWELELKCTVPKVPLQNRGRRITGNWGNSFQAGIVFLQLKGGN